MTEDFERLKNARINAGYKSAAAAAQAFGWDPVTYRAHENGGRGLFRVAERYGRAFGVAPEWLLYGRDASALDGGSNAPLVAELPILGVAEPGAWRESSLPQEGRGKALMAKDSRFPQADQYLLRVQGDAMNMSKPHPITENTLVRCVPWPQAGWTLQVGMIVVVQRLQDEGRLVETTLKRVAKVGPRLELRPETDNPAHKTTVIRGGSDAEGVKTSVAALVTGLLHEFEF